jgi:hypothetical protein
MVTAQTQIISQAAGFKSVCGQCKFFNFAGGSCSKQPIHTCDGGAPDYKQVGAKDTACIAYKEFYPF